MGQESEERENVSRLKTYKSFVNVFDLAQNLNNLSLAIIYFLNYNIFKKTLFEFPG